MNHNNTSSDEHSSPPSVASLLSSSQQSSSSSPPPPTSPPQPWSLSYVPWSTEELNEYVDIYERCMEDVKASWQEESIKYEETISIDLPGHPKEIPRRNYANPYCIVQDDTLFPYHASCYLFLEAYDGLYRRGGAGDSCYHNAVIPQPIPVNSILPSAIRQFVNYNSPEEEKLVPPPVVVPVAVPRDHEEEDYDDEEDYDVAATFLFCSIESMLIVFYQRRVAKSVSSHSSHQPSIDLTYRFIDFLKHIVQKHSAGPMSEEDARNLVRPMRRGDDDNSKEGMDDECELECFPELDTTLMCGAMMNIPSLPMDATERRELLLRLLKHSMSELQKDLILASAVLVRLALDKSFNHVPTFQRILTILCSEYVICPCFECEDSDDHWCSHWKYFLEVVEIVFWHGPDSITRQHGLSMAGFFRYSYIREYGPSLADRFSAAASRTTTSSLAMGGGGGDGANHNSPPMTTTNSLAASAESYAWNLKRTLLENRMENRFEDNFELEESAADPERLTPTRILISLIQGWGKRGERELIRIASVLAISSQQQQQQQPEKKEEELGPKSQQQQQPPSVEVMAEYLDSYYNCLQALVSMALSSAQGLPKSERLNQMASMIIRSIAASLIYIEIPFEATGSKSLMAHDSTYYLGAPTFPQLESVVLSPFRLANRIRRATELEQSQCIAYKSVTSLASNGPKNGSEKDWSTLVLLACKNAVHGRPHESIREAVRILYLRDVVYMNIAGMGYADFVVWCRFAIQPLDPALFFHDCNHIMPDGDEFRHNMDDDDNDDDDSDSDEEDHDSEADFQKPVEWAPNEDGFTSTGELWCHFNFSLVAMVCAWREPWTPSSHWSYSSQFRAAAFTLALCFKRKCRETTANMPQDVLQTIISFMPREAWPLDETFCWRYDCAMKQITAKFFSWNDDLCRPAVTTTTTHGPGPKRLQPPQQYTCKRCGIPRYCSKFCMEQDYKDMHKRICIEPPYCSIDKELVAFVRSIEDGSYRNQTNNNMLLTGSGSEDKNDVGTEEEDGDDDDEDDDDEGSWESMDSNEEPDEAINDPTKPQSLTQILTQFMKKRRNKKKKSSGLFPFDVAR